MVDAAPVADHEFEITPEAETPRLVLDGLIPGEYVVVAEQSAIDVVVSVRVADATPVEYNGITEHVGPEYAVFEVRETQTVTVNLPPAETANGLSGRVHVKIISLGDFPPAVRSGMRFLSAAGRVGDTPDEALRLPAIEALLLALDQFEASGHSALEAYVNYRLGLEFYWTLRNERALDHYVQSRRLYAELGHDRMANIVLGEIGAVRIELGEYAQAARDLELAIGALTVSTASRDAALLTNYLGLARLELRDFDAALKSFESAISMFSLLEDNVRLGQVLGNIGVLYDRTGDVIQARNYYRDALANPVFTAHDEFRAIILTNLSKAELRTRNVSAAIRLLVEARDVQERIGDLASLGTTVSLLSSIYRSLADYDEAIRLQEQAVQLHKSRTEADAYGGALQRYAQDLLTRSKLKGDGGDIERALGLAKKAYAVSKTPNNRVLSALTAHECARLLGLNSDASKWIELGGREHAEALSNETLILLELTHARSPDRSLRERRAAAAAAMRMAEASNDSLLFAQVLFERAKLAKRNRARIALVERALRALSAHQSQVADPWLTTRLGALAKPMIEFQLEALLGGGRRSDIVNWRAFDIAQNGRGRVLRAATALAAIDIHRYLTLEQRESLDQARTKLHVAREGVKSFESEPRRYSSQKLRRARNNVREELARLNQLRSVVFAQLKEKTGFAQQTESVDQKALQSMLGEGNSGLVFYFVGERASYRWFITDETMDVSVLPPAHELDSLVADVRAIIINWNAYSKRELDSILTRASEILVPAELLNTGIRRLVVAADGSLTQLPFAALRPAEQRGGYLAQDVVIEFAEQIGVWSEPRRGLRPVRVLGLSGLTRHPSGLTENELDGLRQAWPSLFSIRDPSDFAEWPKGLNESVSSADVIHIAAHGSASLERWGLSRLHFGEIDGRDFDWLADDVMSTSINADLVFLAACDSAVGELAANEGPLGLSRAFRVAGANEVVATVWRVPERETREITVAFYKNYIDNARQAAEALQLAQKAMIEGGGSSAHPYFWSGFVSLTH